MIKVTRLPSSVTGFFSPLKRFFSPAQWRHFRFLVLALCVTSGRRTIRNLRGSLPEGYQHRTNLHEFVLEAKWSPAAVLRQSTLEKLKRLKPQRGEPLYVILDDTKNEKRGRTMDALGTYKDNAKGFIRGHGIVACVILFRGLILPWAIELHEPKKKARGSRPSKRRRRQAKRPYVTMPTRAARMIEEFPALPWKPKVVVLFDSYYLCKQVVQACKRRGFAFVSRAKSNRNLRVRSGGREYSTKVALRGKLLFRNQNKKGTLKRIVRGHANSKRKFHVISERGQLSKVGQVKLVFSKEPQRSNKIVCLVCSETDWDAQAVLHTYARRWWIEVFFKETKQHLGLGDYQTGHYEGIQKHLCLTCIAFVLLTHVRTDKRREKGKSNKKQPLLAPVAIKTSCDLLREMVIKNELRALAPRNKAARTTFLHKLARLSWKPAA